MRTTVGSGVASNRSRRHQAARPRSSGTHVASVIASVVASVVASIVASGVLVVAWLWWRAPSAAACDQAIRSGVPRRGIALCIERYERTREPRALALASRGYLAIGEIASAEQLARQLLRGPLYGEAHAILSYVALRGTGEEAGDDARNHATIAWFVHALAGDDRALLIDAISLAQAAWRLGDFVGSLQAADHALRLAQRLGDPAKQVTAQMARADALRRIGDTRRAIAALTSAVELAVTPCERAWVHLKSGLFRAEHHDDVLAIGELEAALAANAGCGSHDVAASASLTQARLLRWKDPRAALALLDRIGSTDGETVESWVLRGQLAADRGAYGEADRDLRRADSLEPPDADWRWDIARIRAELAELRGGAFNDLVAELHYRRSIAMVAALRTTARAHDAFFVASHRAPYEGLIALLARHRRWRDALAVVLALDASDMLRATADSDSAGAGLPSQARPRAAGTPARVDDVVSAWRDRDLVIAIAPWRHQVGSQERAYRLRIAGGEVTGEDVGDAGTAITSALALFTDPGNRQAAGVLGRLIVPSGAEPRTLHVLAIGALAKAPLAALRSDDGGLVIARRPIARVLGVLARGPESTAAGGAVVIADPRGDLPSAAAEGRAVAQLLGAGTRLFGARAPAPATRARWWASGDAELLHVASHVVARDRWRELALSDGTAGPDDIVGQRFAPRIAVLAGCGSGAAMDDEGWGSIAAALIESGTAVVIATDRTIDDREAQLLMHGFYAQPDWRGDPARALARSQLQRAATSSGNAWAAFFVLRRPPALARVAP